MTRYTAFICVLSALALVATGRMIAQTTPRPVGYYFNLLEQETGRRVRSQFPGIQNGFAFDVNDSVNNYIEYSVATAEGKSYMKMWTAPAGQVIVARVCYACGPGCQLAQIDFYRFTGDAYSNLTNKLYNNTLLRQKVATAAMSYTRRHPHADTEYWVRLPRTGQHIEVGLMTGQNAEDTRFIPVLKMKFTKSAFTVSRFNKP